MIWILPGRDVQEYTNMKVFAVDINSSYFFFQNLDFTILNSTA